MNLLPLRNQAANWVRFSGAELLELSPQVARLSNGQYHVRFWGTGGSYSRCRGVAVTRWAEDAIADADGFHVYLRDLDDQFVWSAGYRPTQVAAAAYEFRLAQGVAEIVRVDREIETCLSVCVASESDCELRRCRLTNHSRHERRIELTSYVEWVLNSLEADAHHPAFSKLFVETMFRLDRSAILARRRPRSPCDSENWGFHRLIRSNGDASREAIEFETNRMQFIGRGRTLKRPWAMSLGRRLTGDSGPVLDPIASLRTVVTLAPGETQEVVYVLGFGQGRDEVEGVLTALDNHSFVGRAFDEQAPILASSNGDAVHLAGDLSLQVPRDRLMVHPPHRPGSRGVCDGAGREKFSPTSGVGNHGNGTSAAGTAASNQEALVFENGLGGFTTDGREYVIRLRADGEGRNLRPPQPWCNVIANERAGFLVTESGAGYMWAGNSRSNRLTAWHNDPVCDPHGEAMWIRDEASGVFWSPTPGPTPAFADYEIRHGFGYTVFRSESHELSQELTQFMAPDDPVKVAGLRLVNQSDRTRRLAVFSYTHWALGGLAAETAESVTTAYDEHLQAILATNLARDEYGSCVAFSALGGSDAIRSTRISYTGNRAGFIGRGRDLECPAAIAAGDVLSKQTGSGLDPCAAWQVSLELPPGGEFTCILLLGEVENRDVAARLIEKYRGTHGVQQALDEVTQRWRQRLLAVEIETPDREIDLMVNGWLMYQNLSCRIWGRSAYYQPGGAVGFRDQLQDSAAYVYQWPELTRRQIVLHASQQFLEGDVLHWWHPDSGYGLRTRFSDDLLWLPFVAAHYVRTTGDAAILDEQTPFINAPLLDAEEQEAYLRPELAGKSASVISASVYEHCCQAMDRGLTTGPHGLPLIGCGDWNDGMNRIGVAGRGESVWLGFFICHVLDGMLPLCRDRGDYERVERYEAYREQLVDALNTAGWDGAWYRRAFYDNGQPVGSAASDECQIDAIAQAWAVISGVASPNRAALAMKSLEERLVDEEQGMIRLLTPPFNSTPNDPGYIKAYLPGIRENGGQYTHGVLWVVRAMAEMGRGTRAVELLRMLSPISHTKTREQIAVYQTEPYVVAADVYGEPPHVGRGGWTWYTGSAGWMFRVAIESILGFSIEQGRTMVLRPAISSAWHQCRLNYRLPDGRTRYEVTIENPAGKETGVTAATLDGEPASVLDGAARITLESDGKIHQVIVRL